MTRFTVIIQCFRTDGGIVVGGEDMDGLDDNVGHWLVRVTSAAKMPTLTSSAFPPLIVLITIFVLSTPILPRILHRHLRTKPIPPRKLLLLNLSPCFHLCNLFRTAATAKSHS